MQIEVLGSGCARCHKLEEVAQQVVRELQIDADVQLVNDVRRIVGYGVMQTPALVVNGSVKLSGVVSDKAAVTRAIMDELAKV
ncbi:MAG: thioredoxin family protein [Firmicutes bacterium]|nr:thioredoxin family protein [Bacillota bacterium]